MSLLQLPLAEVVKDDGPSKQLHIKVFLLNSLLNKKRWGVTADSIPRYIRKFIGKPLTLFKTRHPKTGSQIFDHPWFNNLTMDQNLQVQERWAVGRIKDIVEDKDGIWSAIVSVTDPAAAKTIREHKSNSLPLFVSPAIVHYPQHENLDGSIFQWEPGHLALVSDPAYPAHIAEIKDTCDGDAMGCMAQLKTASIEECFGKTMSDYIEINTSLLSKIENDSVIGKMSSNSDANNSGTSPASTPTNTSTTTVTVPTSNEMTTPTTYTGAPNIGFSQTPEIPSQNQAEQQAKEPLNEWQTKEQEYNTKISELTARLQEAENSKKNEITKLQEQIDKINKRNELDTRRMQVQAVVPMDLFTNVNGRFDEQAYQAEIDRRVKGNWTLDEIADYYGTKFESFQYKQQYPVQQQQQQQQIPRRSRQQEDNNEEIAPEMQIPASSSSRGRKGSNTPDNIPQLDTASMSTSKKKSSSLWYLDLFDVNVNSSTSAFPGGS